MAKSKLSTKYKSLLQTYEEGKHITHAQHILAFVKANGGATRREIHEFFKPSPFGGSQWGKPKITWGSVLARSNELIEAGELEVVGEVFDETTNRTVERLGIPTGEPRQLGLF